VDVRYPDSRISLTAELGDDALTTVEEVYSFVLRNMPPEVRP